MQIATLSFGACGTAFLSEFEQAKLHVPYKAPCPCSELVNVVQRRCFSHNDDRYYDMPESTFYFAETWYERLDIYGLEICLKISPTLAFRSTFSGKHVHITTFRYQQKLELVYYVV